MFNDNAPERVNIGGARWNPRGVGAIYASFDRETVLAEADHAIEIQPRRLFARRVIYELEVDVPAVIDLTGEGALEAVGLTMSDVTADDFVACQQVGGAAAFLGASGLRVPSARRAGENLVILLGPGGDVEMERVSEDVIFQREE